MCNSTVRWGFIHSSVACLYGCPSVVAPLGQVTNVLQSNVAPSLQLNSFSQWRKMKSLIDIVVWNTNTCRFLKQITRVAPAEESWDKICHGQTDRQRSRRRKSDPLLSVFSRSYEKVYIIVSDVVNSLCNDTICFCQNDNVFSSG